MVAGFLSLGHQSGLPESALIQICFSIQPRFPDLPVVAQVTLTTAPPGYGVGGSVASCSFQGQPPATNLPHATAADTQPHCNSGHGGAGEEGPAQGAPLLHWGQSVQYLDHVLVVHPGEALQVVASWAGGSPPCVRVDLRPGKGVKAPRPPWEVSQGGWGGRLFAVLTVVLLLPLLPIPLQCLSRSISVIKTLMGYPGT
jgi:hypothetical protein